MKYFFTLVLFVTVGLLPAQNSDPTPPVSLPDKIYAFTDKTLYESGEMLSLTFFVLGEQQGKYGPSENSSMVYFEILDGKDEVVYKNKLPIFEGAASMQIPLRILKGGQYTIRSITSWNLNFMKMEESATKIFYIQSADFPDIYMQYQLPRDLFFPGDTLNFDFQVRNENNYEVTNILPVFHVIADGKIIGKSTAENVRLKGSTFTATIVLDDSFTAENGYISGEFNYRKNHYGKVYPLIFNSPIGNISFLPEGGSLMEGIPCNVAFKCIDKNGLGLQVQGIVFDSKNRVVTAFSAAHRGMGTLRFTPISGEKYYARIIQPAHSEIIPLPETDTISNLHLEITKEGDSYFANIFAKKSVAVTIKKTRDNSNSFGITKQLLQGHNKVLISGPELLPGICKVALMQNNYLQCERLVFLYPERQLHLEVKNNSRELKPGTSNNISLRVVDAMGQPVRSILAISLVNEKNHNLVNDKQANMLSSFLLTLELKGYIEEPNWYFSEVDSTRIAALDLVMLTHGWRKAIYAGKSTVQNEKAYLVCDVGHGTPKFSESVARVTFQKYFTSQKPYSYISYRLNFIPQRISTKHYTSQCIKNVYIREDKTLSLRFASSGFSPSNTKTDPRFANGTTTAIEKTSESAQTEGSFVDGQRVIGGGNNGELGVAMITVIRGRDVINLSGSGTFIRSDQLLFSGRRGMDGLIARNSAILSTPQGISVRGTRADGNGTYIDGMRIIGGGNGELYLFDKIHRSSPYLSPWPNVSTSPGSLLKTPVVGEATINIGNSSVLSGGSLGSSSFPFNGNYNSGYSGIRYYHIYDHYGIQSVLPLYSTSNYLHYEYYEPKYATNIYPKDRNPVSTLFCAPVVTTDANGWVAITFNTNMNEAVYRLTAEGFGGNMLLSDTLFFTSKPAVSFTWEIPGYITRGDLFYHKIQLKNNRNKSVEIAYTLLSSGKKINGGMTLGPNSAEWLFIPQTDSNSYNFRLILDYDDWSEIFYKTIEIKERFFSNEITLAGTNSSGTYSFINPGNIQDFILTKSTNGVEEITESAKKLIREPFGCFEQVSSSNYPNLLVYNLLYSTNRRDKSLPALEQYIEKGLGALQNYKTSEGGYEWFGHTPPHQALTAYGLIQFELAGKLGLLKTNVVNETVVWLKSQELPNGGFKNNTGKYNHFSNIPDPVSNAFITYALCRANATSMYKHIINVEKDLHQNFDLYRAALLLNIYAFENDTHAAKKLNKKIVTYLARFENLAAQPIRTITNSTGASAAVEALSLYGQALYRLNISDPSYTAHILEKTYRYKTECSYYQTQATALFLEFLAMHIADRGINAANIRANSHVEINKYPLTALRSETPAQVLRIPTTYLNSGTNTLEINNADRNTIYSASISFLSSQFYYSDTGFYLLTNTWHRDTLPSGGTNSLSVTIENKLNVERGQTVATLYFPDGMQPGPEVLNALMKQKLFDYYEIKNNKLILYFLKFKPREIRRFDIAVTCLYPGNFYIPEPRIFAYYEDKNMNTGKPSVLCALPPTK